MPCPPHSPHSNNQPAKEAAKSPPPDEVPRAFHSTAGPANSRPPHAPAPPRSHARSITLQPPDAPPLRQSEETFTAPRPSPSDPKPPTHPHSATQSFPHTHPQEPVTPRPTPETNSTHPHQHQSPLIRANNVHAADNLAAPFPRTHRVEPTTSCGPLFVVARRGYCRDRTDSQHPDAAAGYSGEELPAFPVAATSRTPFGRAGSPSSHRGRWRHPIRTPPPSRCRF